MLLPVTLLSLLFCGVQAYPQPSSPPPSGLQASVRPLAQFPNGTWVENLAVRSDGKLLVTLFTSPNLYQIDPFQPDQPPELVAQLPECLGTLGIAEIEHDVFAIAKGNVSFTTEEIYPKSFSVWKVAFGKNNDKPALSRIADMPDAVFLNGATTLGPHGKFLLLADSIAGVVWRVNLATSKYDVALNQSVTQPIGPLLKGGFGVNGVNFKDGYLYFTNTNKGFFRVPVASNAEPTGPVETLGSFQFGDDFTFDSHGDPIIARGAVDLIDKFADGKLEDVKYTTQSAITLIEGNTAVKFGRTARDRCTLYVTTNGGQTGLVNGTHVQGGRVLALDFGN